MKNYIDSIAFGILFIASAAMTSEGQTIEKMTPIGPRQVSITASAKGRAVLQWTFDDRLDSIWTSLSESRQAHGGRVTFLAPRHEDLAPRYRVLNQQPATLGGALFNPNLIRVLKLEISAGDLQKMLKSLPSISEGGNGGGVALPGDKEIIDGGDPGDFPGVPVSFNSGHDYVTAVARFDGGKRARIGIRLKGNNSLSSAVINKRDNYPFKVDVNYFKSGQNLDGIQKFNLHPVVSMKAESVLPDQPPVVVPGSIGLEEYLSYGALRAFGMPASRTGWMDVYLNGKYLGLYTVVENMDSTFMERNFASRGGETYKPEGEYLDWKGNHFDSYPDLNWKGGGDGSHRSVIRLIDVINHDPITSFPSVIDVQSIFNYTAANVALGNWDTYEALGHNYLLHEGGGGRFYMLPWDMNLSQSNNPGESLYGKMDQMSSSNNDGLQSKVLTNRIFQDPENDSRYRATLRAFIEGPGSAESLNARIDDAVKLLGTRLEEDAIKVLRSNIESRISKVKTLLDSPTSP